MDLGAQDKVRLFWLPERIVRRSVENAGKIRRKNPKAFSWGALVHALTRIRVSRPLVIRRVRWLELVDLPVF